MVFDDFGDLLAGNKINQRILLEIGRSTDGSPQSTEEIYTNNSVDLMQERPH